MEPAFHADSYGYRPGKSAIDAMRTARERCWLDIDVKGFFDSIDWELLLKAVRHHSDCPWLLFYIERWLKAPVQMEDGSIVPRTAGTPQGGVISPLLANLFLHYAFDMWMTREFLHIPFERYADDAICHCKSAEEARALWSALAGSRTPRTLAAECPAVCLTVKPAGEPYAVNLQVRFDERRWETGCWLRAPSYRAHLRLYPSSCTA